MSRLLSSSIAAAVALATTAVAQAPTQTPPQDPAGPLPRPLLRLIKDWGSLSIPDVEGSDYREVHLHGGLRLAVPEERLEIRARNALLLLDRETFQAAVAERRSGDGLPQRVTKAPAPRRRLDHEEIRGRLARSLRAIGRSEVLPSDPRLDEALDLLRFVYCEGDVVVVRDGVEVLRCERMWLSTPDDRVVVEQAELRYLTPGRAGAADRVLVVRGPKLVKQGPRWVGRDVTITTCTAAEPHYALATGEVEIIERDGEFEVIAHGQTLQLGGTSVLPLPDVRVFTGSQSEFPIKRVRAGYSGRLGAQTQIVLGLPWNATGGAIHNWLLGRPAHEFRGEWELGVGWIQERGFPLEGSLDYRAPGLYRGSTEAFFLDDTGEDLREINANVDGSAIDAQSRSVLRTQNRLEFGDRTHLDLVAYHISDAAAWSEFYGNPYRTEEVPETSTYLHHAAGNRLLTVGTRFNLDDFSYRDDRALAERFVEELPVATYQWLAQPIGMTPWETPIVVDLETEIGQRRSDYDDRAGIRASDRTLRVDQQAEVSTPFRLGPVQLRPYLSGRGTFYDQTVDGESEGRAAVETGVQLATRLSRGFDLGEGESFRHVMAPKVTYRNRFHVDDRADRFFTFDPVDQLTEQQLVRVELRNLLQQQRGSYQAAAPHDLLFLDLAQDLFPDAARDNAGREVGLLYYDLLLRPNASWIPFQNLTLAFYGDHDWRTGLRTLDTELLFGRVLGLDWGLEYRTDAAVDGAAGVSATAMLFERWNVFAGSLRDLDRDEWLAWSFGVRRNDHDWSLEVSAVYNPFADETTLRIEFLPRMGGGDRPLRDRLGNGNLMSPMQAPH
ncbi:MAG: LPS assembly protein LptD [Planctomycetes bacterium]|nr:LPS assembly protein LptD [Planctomycetota bacterium]